MAAPRYIRIIPATAFRDHAAYYGVDQEFENLQLFAYPPTTTVATAQGAAIPPPPPPLLPSYNYYYYPAPAPTMYNNPNYTTQSGGTAATTAAATATFPDYSTYYPYTVNPYNDRPLMNTYYGGGGGVGGAYPSQSTAYRSYPQPDDASPTFYRRSRTAPSRVVPSKAYKTVFTKRNRGYTADPYFFDPREYRSYSGPWKDANNWPMYRKRKEPTGRIQTYQESEFGGSPIDRQPHYYQNLYTDMQPTVLRRIRPYYAPSYLTYPPSIMNPSRAQQKNDERYSVVIRVIVKTIELLLGAATIGLVLAPLRDMSFYTFVKTTQTEWQGLVLGIATAFTVLCLIMLLSACIGYRYQLWRRIDCLISLVGSIAYLFAGAVETYYAACYPPNGERIGKVCYRVEWIIASALIFLNVFVYIVDCVLSFRTGSGML